MQKLKGLLLNSGMLVGLLLVGGEGMSNPVTPVSIYSTQQNQPSTQPSMISYWNTVYPQIASCVSQVIKERLKPSTVDNDENSKDKYIASLGYGSGYYVMIDTSRYTTSDICYIDFTLRQLGYTPHYIEPVERLIVGVFQRKPDAESIADKLKAMKIDTVIRYIESAPSYAYPQSNVAFSQPTISQSTNSSSYVTKQQFTKIIKIINDQFKNQNAINQQLYNEIQELKREVEQLKEQRQQKRGNLVVAQAIGTAHVRSCPSMRCSVVKILNRGEKVYLLGYSDGWAKIKLNENSNSIYYVYKTLLEVKYEN
ncbi:MAG: hypothetical protein ACP5MB_05045 [bacterium]